MNKMLNSKCRPSLGCDPEFFFSHKGQIIGAEKILPNNLESQSPVFKNSQTHRPIAETRQNDPTMDKIIIDGVQAELNPSPSQCRQNLASEIARCFSSLHNYLIDKKEISCDFSQGIKVTEKEMDSLSNESKQFGCAESKNTYQKKSKMTMQDASQYMFRSAGGHLHFGDSKTNKLGALLRRPKRLVPMLDIILGNTCVLIDRDIGNIERRKVYGKAGEYRLPKHGLEYRTLSNFWLRSYPLMSFVFGMARFAMDLTLDGFDKEIRKSVKSWDIKNAINNNDLGLALKNFNAIKPIIRRITPPNVGYPLHRNNLKLFNHFIKKDVNKWFRNKPLEYWNRLESGSNRHGWESFLTGTVAKNLARQKLKQTNCFSGT